MPAIAISRDDELMPIADAGVSRDLRTEKLRALRNRRTVVLGCRRVAQGLMRQVATIADEMAKQDQPVLRPSQRRLNFRKLACDRYAVPWRALTDRLPPLARHDAMIGGRPQACSACQLHIEHRFHARRPHDL